MLLYVLICLCLSLTGIAGLQFAYLFYLDRLDKQRKKRIAELEHDHQKLSERLLCAESRLAKQNQLIEAMYLDEEGEEAWADVIEDR